jgi:hypothetical protein
MPRSFERSSHHRADQRELVTRGRRRARAGPAGVIRGGRLESGQQMAVFLPFCDGAAAQGAMLETCG